MKVLLLGSGGREHALAWKLAASPALEELHAAPGNPGVATAATMPVARPPCVVKADGLAAGKGVHVCRTDDELEAALYATATLGGPVVIEELLEGEEISVFAITDGARTLALPVAQDFKRVGDGDTGPNTGGMGAYAPVDGIDAEEIVESVHRPVLDELARSGSPFVGVLYAGLMLTDDGPRVLEFNCRFGDPETQSVVPRLDGDLLAALTAAAGGSVADVALAASPRAAVTIVLAASGYPDALERGVHINGIEEAEATGALVGILIGSESDREAIEPAVTELNDRAISNELNVLSAHRDPRGVAEYASSAAVRGVRVIIAGAGMAAALPGVVAAYTELPVIGVPLTSSKSVMGGLDAVLSIVQMPPGVPVACVSVNGARNAAILAAKILAQGGGYPGSPSNAT